MKKITTFFRGAWNELEQVTWPTRAQAIRASVVVLVFVGIAGAILFFIDRGLGSLVRALLLR